MERASGMSRRGLEFVRAWTDTKIDPSAVYPYPAKRAALLADACEASARDEHIGRQEIEDEVGNLEDALLRLLQARHCGFRIEAAAEADPSAFASHARSR
jgi:hypothetical protein